MKALLPTAVFLLMVSIGMSLRPAEFVRSWRRLTQHGAWLRLIVATFLIPPAVAMLMLRITPIELGEATGLFLLGMVPGAPLTSRVAAKRGFDMHLAASYQVWGAILVPAMIPLVVYSVAKLYDRNVWIPPRLLLAQIAEKQFAPLLIGVALVYFAAGFAKKIQPAITITGNALLLIMIVAVLWKMRAALAAITPWVVVGAFAVALASIGAVLLLMPGEAEARKTIALCNANRHIGMALLLAGDFTRARNAIPAIACYAIVGPLVMLVYARIVRRRAMLTATA
jgi:BASS family bile acid:Na+ symporter